MQRRYLYAAAGVLLLAAGLAIPGFAQPRWGGFGAAGPGVGCGGMGLAPTATTGGAITLDGAVTRVTETLAASGYTDLEPEEVMEFSNHFYVLVKEKSTGIGAMEVIVERNGLVRPEPGPNMMWNTKYGHMGGAAGMMGFRAPGRGWGRGMMGGPGPWSGPAPLGGPSAQPIGRDRAHQLAAQHLRTAMPGATPDTGMAFYGYFTFDVERDGKTVGMLSVNAYTGQVWYHTWHGTFVQEKHL